MSKHTPPSRRFPSCAAALGVLLGLLLWLVPSPALALDPHKPIHRYALAHFGRETGLPSTSVQALLQSSDGYLWLGTQDGLVRFDGARFELFDSRSTPAIGNNHIQSLAEAGDGALWFTTLGAGIVRFHRGEFRAYTSADGLSSDQVRAVLEDRSGTLWVGTDEGLDRMVGERFEGVSLAEGLGEGVVQELFEDRDGRLWVASRSGGVCVFADGACQEPSLPEGLRVQRARAFHQGADGSMWIGTEGEGLLHIQGDGFTRYTTQEGLSSVEVTSLLEDRDGSLWIGTRRSGLNRIGPGGPEVFHDPGVAGFSYVTSLLEDREGNIWLGSYAGGLHSLREATFVSYGPRDGIDTEVVLSVLEDHVGMVWVGTMRGLYRMHGEVAVPYAGMEGMDQVAVLAMAEDSADALWVGTFGQGLHRFADGAWRSWTMEDGLPSDYVFSMAEDAGGQLWVGTQKGLCRKVGERFEAVPLPEDLAMLTVRVLHLDSQGRLWVGFDGGGLFRHDGQDLVPYAMPADATPNMLQLLAVHESADGTLWFGSEGGLMQLVGEELRVIRGQDGLLDERVWQILSDDTDNLWMSSNLGVYRLSRSDIEEFFAGARAQVTSQVFGTADGMASAECNGGYINAGTRTQDGRLWFPTTRGVAVVDPAEALRPKPVPPVVIEEVEIDGETVDHHAPLVFPAGTWRIDIQFSAPYFIAPEKVGFRYHLDDQDLGATEPERQSTFTNLPPGRYRFHVIATNGYGAWNEEGATLEFEVAPYFWQTDWFMSLSALGLVLVVLGVYWRQQRLHLEREHELEATVAARTRELAELAERQKELSLRDALTSLRNRRFLQETIEPLVGAISRQCANPPSSEVDQRKATIADRVGLAIVDIDHFKAVNDSHGHDVGDSVLQQFSQLLVDTARGQDVVVRWGGEEFLVVLLGADEEGLRAFGERFRRRVAAREFVLPGGGTLRRTCSVGLVSCPFYAPGDLGLELDQLLSVADLGLYQAKRDGRNRCVMVKPGLRPPASRDEATKAFASIEAATEGGYVVMDRLTS
jgi:diguanylate cyclase (GGDEF)-like protein